LFNTARRNEFGATKAWGPIDYDRTILPKPIIGPEQRSCFSVLSNTTIVGSATLVLIVSVWAPSVVTVGESWWATVVTDTSNPFVWAENNSKELSP
jgi:hypothetical protein